MYLSLKYNIRLTANIMEDQSDLCIWQKKEGRIRRYFLLFYLGFNALSTYNHIYLNYNSDVFTNCFHYIYFIFNIEISLAIPRPIFVANVLAGDLHSYSNNRPTDGIHINCEHNLDIQYLQPNNRHIFLFKQWPYVTYHGNVLFIM